MNIKDIMSYNAPYNQKNIESIIENIQRNNIVPYIGAGMSVLFNGIYPTWSAFLDKTYKEFCESSIYSENEFYSLSLEKRAEYLYDEIGNISFSEYLKETFGLQHLEVKNDEFYSKPAYLLPKIFEKGLLITTNYDKVIEKCYMLHGKALTVLHPGHFEALNGALRNNDLLLYKVHGDINEPIESIIITEEQYNKAYSNSTLTDSLKQICLSKSILFLGCSLGNDRPITILRNTSRAGIFHYAIIPCEKSQIKARRIELENEYFTKSIIYPVENHECVFEILNYIERKINSDINKKIKDRHVDINDQWFINQNKTQIKNLGDRYLPDLNVKTNAIHVFDALNRNDEFYNRFTEKSDRLLSNIFSLELPKIQEYAEEILDLIKSFSLNVDKININQIENNLDKIYDIISIELKNIKIDNFNIREYMFYKFITTLNIINDYINYILSDEIKVINNPYILLHGKGGIGKSHLIADVITQRMEQNKKSLLLLGQHFKTTNPTQEILNLLNLSCTFEDLLKTLNDIGMKDNSRIVLFVDALNEGNGKTIWNEHLAGIIEQIKRFPWIGCVVSIRTEYIADIFENNTALKNTFVSIRHTGFSTLEYKAVKKYFEYYEIKYFDIPLLEQEFRNPLFLRLLCESVKNQKINLNRINFTDIYTDYLKAINNKIALKCGYSKHINVVEKVINEIVNYKYIKNSKINFIPLEDCIEIITNIEKKYNISLPLLDELIFNGVLTQNFIRNEGEYIYVTYEKLEDYLYATMIANELKEIGLENFRKKYNSLIDYPDVLEAFAIVLPESSDYEIFDVFTDEDTYDVLKAFCHSLKWRKSQKLKPSVLTYINDVVIKTKDGLEILFEELLLIATKINHDFNAERTVDFVIKYKMPDRDSIFIPLFDKLYGSDGSAIHRLLDWCLLDLGKKNILDETIRLASIILVTFLISSNNILRDKTTHALINLLTGKIDILLLVMDKYKNIDDPYVSERLYAIAFGCIVREKSDCKIEKLALYVYNTVFDSEYVYPNILLRDYAKNIIDYAKYKVNSEKLKALNVQPPYNSNMPEIPSDEEIENYRFNYESENFPKHYWSQNAILNSMNVEYNRRGEHELYGDFGRYTFQYYFSNWENMNYNDLKNIAIKKVFDLGYDVEKHGRYDLTIKRDRGTGNLRERIGKKYQWIALYELAAQVSDNYKLSVHSYDYTDTIQSYCLGSFEPHIRNIDPTISFNATYSNTSKEIHKSIYSIPCKDNYTWANDFNDFPNFKQLLEQEYFDNTYLLLNGWYSWREDKIFKEIDSKMPYKDFWIMINSYIVKKNQIDNYINKFLTSEIDFMGRWAAEPCDNSQLFNKEYYWSEGFKLFSNPYYCGEEWVDFEKFNYNHLNCLGKVLIPSFIYSSERHGDSCDNESASWYKPCSEIFNTLKLSYGKEDTVLYDKFGNVICFDSKELLNEDIGLFIKVKALEEFLDKNGYSIFWTVLSEKSIMQRSMLNNGENFPRV